MCTTSPIKPEVVIPGCDENAAYASVSVRKSSLALSSRRQGPLSHSRRPERDAVLAQLGCWPLGCVPLVLPSWIEVRASELRR